MTFSKYFMAASVGLSLNATAVFADAGSTAVLEEYFAQFEKMPLVFNIAKKENGLRSAKWSGISVATEDGAFTANIPWVEVVPGLLGGHTMRFAEVSDFRYSNPKYLGEQSFAMDIKNDGLEVSVTGEEGDRTYASVFDKLSFETKPSSPVQIDGQIEGGKSIFTQSSGDVESRYASFDYNSAQFDYEFEQKGESLKSNTKMAGLSGDYSFSWDAQGAKDDASEVLSGIGTAHMRYEAETIFARTTIGTPMGPVTTIATMGETEARYALEDKTMRVETRAQNIDYDIHGGPTPPIGLTADVMAAEIGLPLDNVGEAKPLDVMLNLQQLELSDQVWAMFDPSALLPRDKANLLLDLTGDVVWLQKMGEIDPKSKKSPLRVEGAKINAFELDVLGAALKSSGGVQFDNTQFPPEPVGAIDVKVDGAYSLLDTLSASGLLPIQQSLAARGVMAIFFKNTGEDQLSTVVEFKDGGHVTANGLQIK